MWNEITAMFKNYIGNGFAAGLFAVSFLYLLFTEKDRTKRIILLYSSLVTAGLFFCPLFAAGIFRYLDAETYYRILWLLPMTAVIAYAGVRLTAGFSKKWLQAGAALLVCGAIVFTGDYVYDNPFFGPAENRFHVPQTVALVCDAIIVEGREVRAVFPDEMLSYVRQYTGNVRMPYGRETQVARWGIENELYEAMNAQTLDCETLAALAAEEGCHYVILHETKPGQEGMEKNGYHYVETVAGYCIYLQDGAYLGLDYDEAAAAAKAVAEKQAETED